MAAAFSPRLFRGLIAMPRLDRRRFFTPRTIWVLPALILVATLGWTFRSLFPSFTGGPAPVPENRFQNARADSLVKAILDRPLFSSDRSPAPPPPPPETLAAPQPPVLKSHLSGILVLPGLRQALFVADGRNYTALQEGEEIDGWKVRSIETDRVILSSPFGDQILQPSKGAAETVRNKKMIELGNFNPDKQ